MVDASLGRRRLLHAALVLVLAIGAILASMNWSRFRGDSTIDPQQVPRLGQSTVTLVPGLHYLGRLFPSAAYAIETSVGLVLIDSGVSPDAEPVRRELAGLGLDWRRIRAILLTHVHADHSGGAEFLRANTGAMIHAGAGDAESLRAGKPHEALFSFFAMPDTAHPTTLDVELHGDEILTFGDTRIQVISTPGHTPGSTCYLMERGSLRAMFTGDVIMKFLDDDQAPNQLGKPLGTYSAHLPPRYRGNARDFLASLRHLRSLPVPSLVLPGHPVDDREPQSPCLAQSRWESLLDAGIRDMEELDARYTKDGADFLDGIPKELLPGLFYLGEFSGTAVYGFLSAGKLYVVTTPRAAGLLRFLSERLKQLGVSTLVPSALLIASTDPGATSGVHELAVNDHIPIVASRRVADPSAISSIGHVGPLGRAEFDWLVASDDHSPARPWQGSRCISGSLGRQDRLAHWTNPDRD